MSELETVETEADMDDNEQKSNWWGRNGWRLAYTLISCVVLAFLGFFFWHCADLILKPQIGERHKLASVPTAEVLPEQNVVAPLNCETGTVFTPRTNGLDGLQQEKCSPLAAMGIGVKASGENKGAEVRNRLVTPERGEVRSAEVWGATYDLFDKHFTTLLGVLGFFGLLFGVIIPAGAYLLQRQRLKEERAGIQRDVQQKLKQMKESMTDWDKNITRIIKEKVDGAGQRIVDLEQKSNEAQAAIMGSLNLEISKVMEGFEKRGLEIEQNAEVRIKDLEGKVEESKEEAKDFADDAKASAMYVLAYLEKDKKMQDDLYTAGIKVRERLLARWRKRMELGRKDKYVEVLEQLSSALAGMYNNRGILRHSKQKGSDEGLVDYSRAIELKRDYVLAYKNRAIGYRDCAEAKSDPVEKKEYERKAEDDEAEVKKLEARINPPRKDS